jgi:hypothetical protein
VKAATGGRTRHLGSQTFAVACAIALALPACRVEQPGPVNQPPSIGSTPPAGPPATAGRGGSAGTGGTGGSGGSGGGAGGSPDTGGPPRTPDAAAIPDAPVRGPVGNPSLDDLEDCNAAILPNDGRAGDWYQYLDEFGSTLTPAMFTPEMGGSPVSSRCAVHVRGMIFSDPAMMKYGFAGVGFVFAGTQPFDSSGYDGISFWAKGTGQMRAAVAVPATTDVMFGGTCMTGCGDAYGLNVELTPQWKRYELRWSELSQAGWGTAAIFDERQMTGIDFGFGGSPTFDAWIDDVAYLTPGGQGGDGGAGDTRPSPPPTRDGGRADSPRGN